ncbi:uncharacterized protein LOC133814560, partial [Humulus lupulus]|uniref:uncharacterized protein LOC133814560 n=1 Tax=Humulus lupulus TaxID=3486 RepID=UPI002B411AD6
MGVGEQLPANLETKDPTLERLALMEEQMLKLLSRKKIDDCDFDEELEPFAPNIAAVAYPSGFRMPKMSTFDGNTDPSDHLRMFNTLMMAHNSRQKSYSDQRRRSVEFQVGDHVFLRVSPLRGVKRFGVRGKLSPRFVGPFEVLERVGEVAYRLAMPPALSGVHDVFHVSMLRKYVSDTTHVLSYENLESDRDLSYEEKPVQILDRKDKVLRSKTIPLVKILWRNSKVEEATWELESDMRKRYPE